jgi:hypothetical protein
MMSSARCKRLSGIVTPSAFAVQRIFACESPLRVKSTHYRIATLTAGSPQSTDISAIGGHLLAPSWTEFQASLLAVRVIPGLR